MNTDIQSSQQRIISLEKKLRQKQKELQDCQKYRDEFVDLASHELKAPMRKLRTFSERLREKSKALNDDAMIYVGRIEKTVASMQSLVDGLSLLSNIGTEFDFISCDLNEILAEVLNDSAEIIEKKQAKIRLNPLPVIEAGRDELKQVFTGLLENSLKFQPEGQAAEVSIESTILPEEEKIRWNLSEKKVYFQIKFADNGIGFTQENAEVILKPFERLNGKSSYPGNGLGLAICKKIIDMHSGIFLAEGNENIGSAFILILPQTHE